MNQTYLEWYEFDVNFMRILIATCTYEYERCSEYE